MPLNKVSIARLLSKKAPFLSVTEETSIEQTVSGLNVQRKGSIVSKKIVLFLVFLPSATFFREFICRT